MKLNSKDRILEVAKEEFSKKGFHEANLRDICKKADANLGLIKYYFKTKKGLYLELIQTFMLSKEKAFTEINKNLIKENPEKALYTFIKNILYSFNPDGSDNWFQSLIQHELLNPSSNLEKFFLKKFHSDLEELELIFKEITGSKDKHLIKKLAEITIAQCFFYASGNHFFLKIHDRKNFKKEHYESLIDIIYNQTIYGVHHFKEE